MFRDIRKNKIFNRRVLIVTAGQATLTGALISRLGFLQLYKHKDYSIQSDSNSIEPIFRAAQRGVVYDRNGTALTQNYERYQLFLYIESEKSAMEFVDTLCGVLNASAKTRGEVSRKVLQARRRSTVLLLDDLNWNDLSRIESSFYKLDGATIERQVTRTCLFPYEMAHVIGYVSLPVKEDIENAKDLRPVFLSPGFRIGRSGVEKVYDEYLRGKYGVKYIEVNSLDRPIRIISEKEPSAGNNLATTIDLELQKFAFNRLEGKVASATVLNVKTGEVLACVSTPSFDVNQFSEGISQKYWDELNSDKRLPMHNRALSAIYPPGSVFKVMTALAALENGYDANHIVNCKGHTQYGNRKLHCWKKEGHGKLNLVEAIEKSCNIYFFELAETLGIEKINEVAKRFGYGQDVDVELEGVSFGNLPTDKWKRKVFGKQWVGGDTLNCAIGQGFVLATPFQVALAMARFANGGYKIKPSFIKSAKSIDQIASGDVKKIIKDEAHFKLINQGLNNVVNNKGGTAYYKRIVKEGFEMAGKTGTSQVVSKRDDEMSRSELRLRANKNHAIFAGYAPVSNPKYAISVVVEHGGSGSATAAPMARDLLLKAQELAI